ncbi:magnesium transporter [Corynebacterium lujinxingii]|uniref:Magnesium transporter MgtE n=1 Tax=Corynebacterium lujinxingii TaxID=2763010 RepID=A0A7H0K1T8_9CORY|nr:magnesium transporter [Corynebacterium lujinxingii]MBC3179304.1 magnesium transporter [Corynebacterium lujinxingii]NNO10179.1 magnesium transporter [Corynebacterium lujinxingii]QNP91254.1 magnesium transporter [Corynebacterium lujinxingii]
MNAEMIADLEKKLRRRRLGSRDLDAIQHGLSEMPLDDVIDLVERQPAKRGAVLVRLLPHGRAAVLFDALDPAHQAEIVEALGADEVAGLFDALGTEDRVMLLDYMPPEIAERFLNDLDEEERADTNLILGYEKGSVGRVMSPNVEVVGVDETVRGVVDKLRANVDDLETIYTVPVVDDQRLLAGVLSLRDLFKARADERASDVMRDTPFVRDDDNAEDAARRLLSSGLLAFPVVNDERNLVGIFTYDEAQDIVEHADSEDSARQGGAESLKQPYLSTPVLNLVRSRIVWLLVLAVSAILTVQVLGIFEDTLAEVTVLSLFIPLLTGTGGNTGNQAATTVTRALALHDVTKGDILKVMWREFRVGATLGAVLGVLGLGIAWAVFGQDIGIVIGSTLFCVCAMSATVGGMMPIVAKTVGADPAVFSNPFISTFCDATGLVIYFAIAKTVLGL